MSQTFGQDRGTFAAMKLRNAITYSCTFLVLTCVCLSQSQPPTSVDIVDAAMRIRGIAQQAQKLTPNGIKYCRWSDGDVKIVDLDNAVSEFLLKANRIVPERIDPSKIWRVSFVATEMENELSVGVLKCALVEHHDKDAHHQFDETTAIHDQLLRARLKFADLAVNATLSFEEHNWPRLRDAAIDDARVRSLRESTIEAARDLSATLRDVEQLDHKAASANGCLTSDQPAGKLDANQFEDLFRASQSPEKYVPATAVWTAFTQLEDARLRLFVNLLACSRGSTEKKKVRDLESETLAKYADVRRLSGRLATLGLAQTEWEEQQSAENVGLREQ